MKKSQITINVSLNENNIPDKISVLSSDDKNPKEIKSFMLSLWDPQQKETLKIDLWTKDMLLDEMKFFICQTISSMKQVALKSLDNEEVAEKIDNFSFELAKDLGIKK